VRQAKKDGLPVTCEASPHHIALTDEDVRIYGTAGKMSPPLRSVEDQEAVIAGLQDGTIDALATDHAPHTIKEKLRLFTEAPNGILGFETAVGILFTKLVHTNLLSLTDTIQKLTIEPARILGIEGGTLSLGKPADITVIDPDQEWVVDANQFKSKSRNTPFHGWTLKGRAVMTVLRGRITHRI
jgi:dihydroorotase